jgi:microcystin-dependent protein
MSYRQRLTDGGRDIIAKGQTGLLVTFTRIGLGQGQPTWGEIPELTALLDPVMNSPIVGVARTAIGQVTITTVIPLGSIPQEFFLNEIGVFATVGSEPEALYAVSIAEGPPDPISPEMGGGSRNEHTLQIAVAIGTTENVTAVFNADMELVNIGQGAGVFANRLGNQFRLKRISGVGATTVTEDADTIRVSSQTAVPVGAMMPYAGPDWAVPPGWLVCNGAWYPKAQYPALAAVVGNFYGGDANNLALPDCRNRTLVGVSPSKWLGLQAGEEQHVLAWGEMPWHGHTVLDYGHSHVVAQTPHGHGLADPLHNHPMNSTPEGYQSASGLFIGIRYWDYPMSGTYYAATGMILYAANANISINPSQSNIGLDGAGGNQPHNNMQPYLAVNYIIRSN